MKALQYTRFGSPDVLELVDRPIPQATEEDAVVQVEAAAVQPSDIKGVAGAMDGTVLPRTPGRDFSGMVVQGPTWLLGRAVWGTAGDLGFSRGGTHAEYVRFPVAGLGQRPWGLSAEEAAAVPVTFITAWIGLLDGAQVREGETVIVFGVAGRRRLRCDPAGALARRARYRRRPGSARGRYRSGGPSRRVRRHGWARAGRGRSRCHERARRRCRVRRGRRQ